MSKLSTFLVNGTKYEVELLSTGRNAVRFRLGERTYEVSHEIAVPQQAEATKRQTKREASSAETLSGNVVKAPIPGIVVEVLKKDGDSVTQGDIVLRLEAMKMQNSIFAPKTGTLDKVFVGAGEEVTDGQPLFSFK